MERTPFDMSKLMYDTPPTEQELKLFEALSQIQQRLGREFFLPDRDLTQDEIRTIFSVRDVLLQGTRNFGRVTFQTPFGTKAAADAFLGVDRRGARLPSFRIAAPPQTYVVLECEIDAGPCFIQTGEVMTVQLLMNRSPNSTWVNLQNLKSSLNVSRVRQLSAISPSGRVPSGRFLMKFSLG